MKTIEERLNFIESKLQDIKELLQKENTTAEDVVFPPISELTLKEDLDKFPNSIFFFHGDTFILELEKIDDKLIAWVNYSKIWHPIYIKNDRNYDQTQAFLKVRIEESFKLKDVTPLSNQSLPYSFKLKDVTPLKWSNLTTLEIEESFKLKDVKPQRK